MSEKELKEKKQKRGKKFLLKEGAKLQAAPSPAMLFLPTVASHSCQEYGPL